MRHPLPPRTAVALLAAFMAGGCASYPRLATVPVTVSGKPLRIWTATAQDTGDTISVEGMVRRPSFAHGPVAGHLHIVALLVDGRSLVADTGWGNIPARGARIARYFVRLPIADASSVTNITVSYVASRDVVDAPSGSNR